MTRKQIEALMNEAAARTHKLTWVKSGYAHSPFISKFATVAQHQYNTSFYSIYSLLINPDVHYVTVMGYYNGQYILKCGEPYLEGQLTDETATKLVTNALIKAQCDRNSVLAVKMKQSFKLAPRSSSCNFNQKNYEEVGPICEHIAQFLKDMPDDVLDKLYDLYHNTYYDANQDSNSLKKKFDRYAFRKHLLLEGEKGSGKTYHAMTWSRGKGVEQLFVGGHEQFESIDFLGHYIQQKNGELVWKDGPLSEAFRKANTGVKILLVIDELLRIPKRELNILISALSPIEGKYTLRTGRAVAVEKDIAQEEVLTAPMENLWVIGTTNMGAGYAVEEIDEALIDRFKPIRKDTTEQELQRILTRTAKQRSFSLGAVQRLMDFYGRMKRLYHTDILKKIVNLRHLNEALELAEHEGQIQEIIEDSMLLWVERDYEGYPDKEQLEAIETVMLKVWKLYD